MSGFNLRRTLVAASVTAVAVGGITIGTAGPAGAWITKSPQASAVCVDGKVVVNASIANGEKAPKKDQPLDWNDMLVTASTLGLSDGPKLATIDGETVTFAINTGKTSVSDGTVVFEFDWANPGRPGTDKRSASYKAVDCKPDQPDPKVDYSEWKDGDSSCETGKVTQTRTKTVTPYKWDDGKGEYVPDPDAAVVTTESQTRDMTAEELKTCNSPPDGGYVCHATASFSNPYSKVPASTAGLANGHMGHNGSLFDGVTKGWGDIIPPFVYNGQPLSKNWPAGQSIWANGCEVDKPEPPEPKVVPKKDNDLNCDGKFHREWDLVSYPVWNDETGKYEFGEPVVENDTGWVKVRDLTEAEEFKLGCVTPAPSVDIEKYSSYDGPEAGDFDDTAKGLDPTADTPVSFIVTNNGNEPLVNVAVSDETTAGVGTLTGVSCDFSKLGGPATGTTWSGPFLVDDAFPCTGTLPALGYDATHTDVATVTADGKYSETSVSDDDPWNGETPPKGEVAIPTFGTEDPCNGPNVSDNVTWTTPLPENSETTQYSESADGTTRTATLVDANGTTWTDGTTEPKVYTLPEDSGVECTPDPVIDLDGNVDVDCRGAGSATMDNTGSTVAHGFEVIVNGEPTLYMVGAGKSRTEPVTGAKPGSWVKVTDGDGNVLDKDRTPRSCGGTTTTTTTDNPQGGPGGGPEQNNAPWLWVILGSMVVAGFAGRRAGVQFARH